MWFDLELEDMAQEECNVKSERPHSSSHNGLCVSCESMALQVILSCFCFLLTSLK